MTNSDWIYQQNKAKFKRELYNREAKLNHKATLKKTYDLESIGSTIDHCTFCSNRFKSFLGGLFTNKIYCQFCDNFVC